MSERERYINLRLMELVLISEERPLEELEKNEERSLLEELEKLHKN